MTSSGRQRLVDHRFVASGGNWKRAAALGDRGGGVEQRGRRQWTNWSPEGRRPWPATAGRRHPHGCEDAEGETEGGYVQEDDGAHPRCMRWLGVAGDDHNGRVPVRTRAASGGRRRKEGHD